jgi:hypothetical protein
MEDFQIGDKVQVISTGTFPVESDWFKRFLRMEGEIKKIEPFPKGILYNVELENRSTFWFGQEHLKQTNQINFSSYPHVCPRCKSPAYVSFLNNIDCSNKDCK